MLNRELLRKKMKEKKQTCESMGKIIGINKASFSKRVKAGIFTNLEIQEMLPVLGVDSPMEIFFADQVSL